MIEAARWPHPTTTRQRIAGGGDVATGPHLTPPHPAPLPAGERERQGSTAAPESLLPLGGEGWMRGEARAFKKKPRPTAVPVNPPHPTASRPPPPRRGESWAPSPQKAYGASAATRRNAPAALVMVPTAAHRMVRYADANAPYGSGLPAVAAPAEPPPPHPNPTTMPSRCSPPGGMVTMSVPAFAVSTQTKTS